MKKKLFVIIALLTAVSSNAFADTNDKLAGSWRPLDPIFGNTTLTLTNVGTGLFHLVVDSNGTTQDFGTVQLEKEPAGLAGKCGALRNFVLTYPIANNDQAEFRLVKTYCPDGSVYGKVNHMSWSYDSMTSSDNGTMKDVMMMATLKFVE